MILRTTLPAVFILCATAVPASGQIAPDEPGGLFDRVAMVLERNFYDKAFRREQLPALVARYRPAALAAENRAVERAVVHGFLGQIPASHLALYSRRTFASLLGELRNESAPSFGFALTQAGARYFVSDVRVGGAADRAGISIGDRVVSIDGEPPQASARLDWRSDDAWLDDPPVFAVLTTAVGEGIAVEIERKPGESYEVIVEAIEDSGLAAAERSVEVIEHDGQRVGYVHFWLIHMSGCATLLQRVLRDDFADCDTVVLDLRGRGGSAAEVSRILKVLERELGDRRLFALQDRLSRSAKEVLSYEIKKRQLGTIVGERSAGAVLPATFRRVTKNAVLMFPAFTIGAHSELIEAIGVEPDVHVQKSGAYAAGADPIFDAVFALTK